MANIIGVAQQNGGILMDIAVIGLGLIGGSLARTIKLHTEHRVFGCDLNAQTMQQAYLLEAIDGEATAEKLRECGMVLVCLYPGAIVEWVKANAANFAPGTLVIDCGGVKQSIYGELIGLSRGSQWHYLGGHPMAGREYSGFRYARDDLFDNASMILCTMGDDSLDVLQTARAMAPEIPRCNLEGHNNYTIVEHAIAYGCKKLTFTKGFTTRSMMSERRTSFSTSSEC